MAITPICDRCGLELLDYGAILLSPPDEHSKVIKFHLCKSCYLLFESELHTPRTRNSQE